MNDGGVLSASWLWFEIDAGNTATCWMRIFTASAEEFIHFTNFAASAGCFEFEVTASVSPPQMPTVWSPAFQAGSGTAPPLPAGAFGGGGDLVRPPLPPDPAGEGAVVHVGVPLRRPVRLGADDALLDEVAPEVRDLLRGRVVDRHIPRVARGRPPVGTRLLGQPGEPARVGRGEVAD